MAYVILLPKPILLYAIVLGLVLISFIGSFGMRTANGFKLSIVCKGLATFIMSCTLCITHPGFVMLAFTSVFLMGIAVDMYRLDTAT